MKINKLLRLRDWMILPAVLMWVVMAGCSKSGSGSGSGDPDPDPPTADKTFMNPIKSSGPDPWVIQQGAYYYYTQTSGNKLSIWKSQYVADLSEASEVTIWTAPTDKSLGYNADIWAPELHFLDNKWYLYFAGDNNGDNATHRIYVLENSSADPTSNTWEFKGKVADPEDKWAIDQTVFTYKGVDYMAWSGWPGDADVQQCIYIAKLANPYTIEGHRVMIAQPKYTWEDRINEGPEALINKEGQLFMTYSGNGCWSDDYCLGLLTLKKDGDPMNPDDWTKSPQPVLSKNVDGGSFGPGHNGFFKSPDGKEDWIIYHANELAGQACGNQRNPRIQSFSWNSDGSPDFGVPVSIHQAINRPSGE